MSATRFIVHADLSDSLTASFVALRHEYELSVEYPSDAVAEAMAAMASAQLPDRDETGVPFFTIDPVGSMDLDQAMCLETEGDGFRVRYAIADVPLFVTPGGLLDEETRRRGETVYLPDMRIPLHPAQLSEGSASLLAGEVRSAFVWDMHLDARGEVTSAQLYRARVKSTERLNYAGVQADVDAGKMDERLTLLKQIGELRAALEAERGGASLPMPAQEVDKGDDGRYTVSFRPPVPSEDWNAQISLMTGMVAAKIMLEGKVGILRTMPAPEEKDLNRFRLQAQGLGIEWQDSQTYGGFLRGLDRDNPKHVALVHEAVSLFRGAGYTPFDGESPELTTQAAVAAPYAHVTAPLRRLVDRFGLVICEALSNGREVPAWAREALPTLPDIMKEADRRAAKVDRACIDRVEAATLEKYVGQSFAAFVVEDPDRRTVNVQLREHAVVAPAKVAEGGVVPEAGCAVTVRLEAVDVQKGALSFVVV